MRLRVEDLAVVLHLLTKRREDLVGMRTQTINRLHRLLVDLGSRRRRPQPHRQARRCAACPARSGRRTGGHPLAACRGTQWQRPAEQVWMRRRSGCVSFNLVHHGCSPRGAVSFNLVYFSPR
jgi:hypothetical protein